MSKSELKPCPFCGSTEPLVVVDDETEMLFGVRCSKCEAAIEAVFVKRKGAVDTWNRRINDDND